MRDSQKTRKQLIQELQETRRQLEVLAASEVERRETASALQESEDKFYKVFRSSPDMIIITNIEEAKWIEVNDSYLKVTGYTRDELIGHTVQEVNMWVYPEEFERMTELLQTQGLIRNEEFSFRVKSGEIRQWLCSAELINIEGETRMIAVATDITERKLMEQALRESEEKFFKAFNSSPVSMIITTLKDGRFIEVNESHTRLSGFTRGEVIGQTTAKLKIWADLEDRKRLVQIIKQKGRFSNEEVKISTKSGKVKTVLMSAELISIGDEECMISSAIDVTELRQTIEKARESEYLREIDKLRTELLANISHELRTPLSSIKGFATMLLDYETQLTSQEKHEYLETIDKNTDRLVELIDQLLEMSRLGLGILPIYKTITDISDLCWEVIEEVRIRAPHHQFTITLPSGLPLINVDERRIRQVLDNILSNSIKYSDKGTEINLTVRQDNTELLFSITDQGTGIPKDELTRVFQRMFHIQNEKKTGVPGAGLGLSICKGLVEAHGGRIWIESEKGKGTKCFFTLPLDSVEGDELAKIRDQ